MQPNDVRNSPKDLPTFNDATRKFNGAKDVSRDFSISQDNTDRGSMSDQAFACSASSVESLPSASGSSELLLFALGFRRAFVNVFFAFVSHVAQVHRHWYVQAVQTVQFRPKIE